MERIILHCDLNNFYASVECIADPSLKDKYVAVCGDTSQRHGIVLAKNTAAKNMGVKTAEPVWEAKQKCPSLVVVPPHFDQYVVYSNMVRDIYLGYTDKVESFGLDECWLDITRYTTKSGKEVADELREKVKKVTGLTISVGVSFNKVYAKLGSDLKKPDATTVLDRGNYKEKVFPLPVGELLMIGRRTAEELNRLNIYTIGDLANADDKLLTVRFGVNGEKIKKFAAGEDDSPVCTNGMEARVKSVGHGTTTKQDIVTLTMAKQTIYALAEMVATRMRRYNLKGQVAHINVRFNDLEHKSRQCKLSSPTYCASDIAQGAYSLLKDIWHPLKDLPIRTLTITMSSLTEAQGELTQCTFFDQLPQKEERMEKALDKIRSKYGFSAVKRAILLDNVILTDKFCEEDDLLPFKRNMP